MNQQEYDVIIVGAGSSGGTLAARLSEDGARSVLLLEAGPAWRSVDELPAGVKDPGDVGGVLPGQPTNWVLETEDPDALPHATGRGLGGSGSINGAYFVRGIPENFHDWERQGNDEWSYEKVLPFYKRLESEQDYPDEDVHGTTGPIAVRREPGDRAPEFTQAFTQACLDLAHPADPDKNGGSSNGVGLIPLNIANGLRVSSAVGYLLPNIGRPNLHIVGDALAHRVVIEGNRCVGVEADVGGRLTTFRGGEVVLSAGALRSPQLLMLSGIGPAEHLRAKGIEVLVDLPGVGENLTDHAELTFPYSLDAKWEAMPGRGAMTSALHWTAEGSDRASDLEILPFVASFNQLMHMSRIVRNPRLVMTMFKEMAKMARRTSLKAVAEQGKAARLPFILINLQQKDHRGTLKLASSSPKDLPALSSNVLGDENDRRRLREGIKVAFEIFQTAPMRAVNAKAVGLDAEDVASRESTDAWMLSHVFAAAHPSCTAKMGPESDPMAVVDQSGRVYGVDNLRVCDTSIFPEIPSRGPNATAIMVAERISELFGSSAPSRADRPAVGAKPGTVGT